MVPAYFGAFVLKSYNRDKSPIQIRMRKLLSDADYIIPTFYKWRQSLVSGTGEISYTAQPFRGMVDLLQVFSYVPCLDVWPTLDVRINLRPETYLSCLTSSIMLRYLYTSSSKNAYYPTVSRPSAAYHTFVLSPALQVCSLINRHSGRSDAAC